MRGIEGHHYNGPANHHFTHMQLSPVISIDTRLTQLCAWLATVTPKVNVSTIRVASADASFRRYFRVDAIDGTSYIVMDAPPDKEDVARFVRIAELFGQTGITVPRIIAQNVTDGFLLLTDLGVSTYLSALTPETCDDLYLDAIEALITLQKGSQPDVLPNYDRARLGVEMDLFPQWYVGKHLNTQLSIDQQIVLRRVFDTILDNTSAQECVFVHRDYHSRNLMVINQGNPGILDFQDALYGPVTYDLVSLLRDAYVRWDDQTVTSLAQQYWQKAGHAGIKVPTDFAQFQRDFDMMGLQRHLKVLGIFARLYHRDGKSGYLKDLPLVLAYTKEVAARYKETAPLVTLLDELGAGDANSTVGRS